MDKPLWWSESKGAWVEIEAMYDMNLLNAYRKLVRGDYRENDGEPPSIERNVALMDSFDAEFGRRNLDPQYRNGRAPVEDS